MGIRITNKIMQNNSISNINNIKTLEDKYNTQISTGKVITKPSDDPVVAIRALRLRNSVNETSQYYKKNVPDAVSWMQVTEKALDQVADLITNIYDQCTKGTQSYEKASDLSVIVTQMRQFANEIYAQGNIDYAGRTVFTGYRTGEKLTFDTDTEKKYNIWENVSGTDCFDTTTYVDYSEVDGITQGAGKTELDIQQSTVNRIRLAYKDVTEIDVNDFSIKFATGVDADGNTVYSDLKDGVTYTDENGTVTTISGKYEVISVYDSPVKDANGNPYTYTDEHGNVRECKNVYEYVANCKNGGYQNAVVLVPETGEVLLGKDIYTAFQKTTEQDIDGTEWDESEIVINYQKSQWHTGETRPEHYFKCFSDGVEYNFNEPASEQVVSYDVGLNQNIRVNTTATEVFDHGIGRMIDEIEDAITKLTDLEKYRDELKELYAGDTGYQEQLDAVSKAYDLMKDKVSSLFSTGISSYQKYLNKVNLAETNEGSRSERLDLINNRLAAQFDTFRDLQSSNEDADATEVAINLTSASNTYEAALMATSKLVSTTLLNYI